MIDNLIFEHRSEEHKLKEKLINDGLARIEHEHIDWFKSQESDKLDKEHKSINDFVRYIIEDTSITIQRIDSLPIEIESKVQKLIQSIFSR